MTRQRRQRLVVGAVAALVLATALFIGLSTSVKAAVDGAPALLNPFSSPLPEPEGSPLPNVFLSAVPHPGVEAGGVVTFTISVVNEGSADAEHVVVTDQLPAKMTFLDSLSTPAPQVEGQTATWELGLLAANGAETASIVFTARVSPEAPTGLELVNRAKAVMDGGPAAFAELVHRVNVIDTQVEPEDETTIEAPVTGLGVDFPSGAVSRTVKLTLTIAHVPTSEAEDLELVGKVFFLEAVAGEDDPVTSFARPYTLTVRYEDAWWQQAGVRREEDLNLFYWHEANLVWVPILPCAGCQVDTVENRVIAVLDHFTEFAMGSVPNRPPDAVDDLATTAEDTAWPVAVLVNDDDPERDHIFVSAVGLPGSGSVTVSGDEIIYDPELNFNGSDVFTYTISDGEWTDTALVSVTVTPVNDAPEMSDIGDRVVKGEQAIVFVVEDVDTPLEQVQFACTSSNTGVIPDQNIVVSGSGAERTITIVPVMQTTDITRVVITVVADDGTDSTGDTFEVTVDWHRQYAPLAMRGAQ